MKKVLLLKFGELFLKGKNKKDFENLLMENIKAKLSSFKYKISYTLGRIVISDYELDDEWAIVEELKTVFGLIGVSKAVEVDTSEENIFAYASSISLSGTFRVNAKRADKKFPLSSMELERKLGEVILTHNENLKVDLHNPEHIVYVEIDLTTKLTYIMKPLNVRAGFH